MKCRRCNAGDTVEMTVSHGLRCYACGLHGAELAATYGTPRDYCPACRHVFDRASGIAAPRPGDLTVCIACTAALVFDADLRTRLLTQGELAALPAGERDTLERVQAAVHQVRRAS